MAADILVYRSEIVPVGQDQLPHIEIAQDIAGHFNNTYGTEVLVRPEPRLNEAAIVPGTDGRKMSKSYGNAIGIFESPGAVRKKVMSIRTDSTPVAAPKNPSACNVLALLRHFIDPAEMGEWVGWPINWRNGSNQHERGGPPWKGGRTISRIYWHRAQ